MLDKLAPYLFWIKASAVVAVLAGVWFYSARLHEAPLRLKVEAVTKERDAAANTRKTEVFWQGKFDELERKQNEGFNNVNRRLESGLIQLRNRPDRASKESLTKCQGASGAELSRPDGEFLERYAARAERIRKALGICYEAQDTVTLGEPK